ncbi:beta-glucosidase [Phormidium tenue FACHB-886]|nr:beta-glucosidase [Phormidium tenue FACHB-886]
MTIAAVGSPLPDWETLSLAQQVAQLIVVRASGHLFDQQILYPDWEPPAAVLHRWVQELGVGGVILLGGSAAEVALKTQQLQAWADVPLFLCADIEEGVGQRFAGATWFPPPLALGAIARHNLPQAVAYAKQMGAMTAQEALAIGINWVLAPVVDINNNPDNPVINVRAWGETPTIVSQLTAAFLQGMQRHPVLNAVKHFPGHGDTAADSHLELPVIPHDRARLNQVELVPFVAAIAQGADAVMSAHLQIPALDAEQPATFSHAILTGELRQRLGFEGLIVTDALVMGAITQRYGANEAPVLAIEAGADVLMMPIDPEGAIQAICAAVENGRIPIETIQASLERIWQAKRRVSALSVQTSPHVWEQLSPPPVDLTPLAQPATIATAAAILRDSLRVHHPQPNRLTQPQQNRCNLLLVDDLLNSPFLSRQAPAITIPRERGYSLQLVDRHTPNALSATPIPTLLQLFVRSTPFRGTAGLTPLAWDRLNALIESGQLEAVMLYGSPYALEALLPHLPAYVSYVFTYGQMPAAQAIALEALFGQAGLERAVGDRVFTD